MAIICPFAIWRPLPEATSQPAIIPRVVIFHTMVGSLAGTERHFRDNTGVESHFGVGGPTDGAALDGALWQWMDLGREADANLDANAFAISVETSDGGDPSRPWSPKQLATLVRLGNWLADRFNIPRRQCPAWDRSGFGWHVMFGAPSHWTPVAKTCPGPVRIQQLKQTVLPAIFAGKELDMAFTDEDKDFLRQIRDTITGEGDFTARINTISKVRGDLAGLPTAAEIAAAVIAALPTGAPIEAAAIQAACEAAVRAVFADAAHPFPPTPASPAG